jgi:hypothetical protein
VRDTGIGIDAEDLSKVFFVFRRGKNTATCNVPGKGVGLASVKSIIETYNGTIWVESEVGKGQHVPVHDQREVRRRHREWSGDGNDVGDRSGRRRSRVSVACVAHTGLCAGGGVVESCKGCTGALYMVVTTHRKHEKQADPASRSSWSMTIRTVAC